MPWLPGLLVIWSLVVLWPWITAPLDFKTCYMSCDDSFYYYSFAQNLAHGQGPTVDGVVPTNGVQPLWAAWLTALAAAVPDREAYVTAVLVTGGLSLLLAGVFWCRVAWRLGGGWLAWTLAVVMARAVVSTQWALLTGMEISLNLALLGGLALALLDLHDHGWRHPVWGPLGLGALLAAFLLGRIDHLAFLVLPVLAELVCRWRGRSGLFPAVDWRHVGLVCVPVVLAYAPYLAWNKLTFGHWLPVSGVTKLWRAQRVLAAAGVDTLGEHFDLAWRNAWWHVARPLGWVLTSLTGQRAWGQPGAAALAGALVLTLAVTPARQRSTVFWLMVLALAALLPRTLVHGWRLDRGSLNYAVWYLTLAWPVALFLVAHGFWRVIMLVPRWRGVGPALRVAVLVYLCVTFFPRELAGHRWEVANADLAWRAPMAKVAALRWAEAHAGPDDVIGSLNSGVLHYYAKDRKVLNLDGRVDDGHLLRILMSGGSVLDSMHGRGVTILVDADDGAGLWRLLREEGRVIHEQAYGRQDDRIMAVARLSP